MTEHEETWLVQLSNGSVRAMSLDELDTAYQEGVIDEETFVRSDAAPTWSKLRDVLGEEPAPAPIAAAPAPAVSYGAVPSYPPAQFDQPLQSVRPVVSEIDQNELDLDLESPFKKSRKRTFAILGASGVAVAVLAVVAATKIGGSASETSVGASIANAAPTTPAVVNVDPPQPVHVPQLDEDRKKALAEMDKQHTKTWEQQRQNRAAKNAASSPLKHPASQPFHKGGSAYDPLNAKL